MHVTTLACLACLWFGAGYFTARAIAAVPRRLVIDERADVIELNHYYDSRGRRLFSQLIFWEWRREEKLHRVFAYRVVAVPREVAPQRLPNGDYVLLFRDDELLRRIRSPIWRETWLQYDPEQLDRDRRPCRRRGLAGPR